MFRNLLRPDSALMITMNQITDCIFLSLFWLLGCFPVVTMGASFAALYDATYRGFRCGEKHPWHRFLKVFKENWEAGIIPTIVFLGLFALLAQIMIALWNAAVYGTVSWMLSRFENSVVGLLKNTVLLSLANVPKTLALGFVNTLSLLLCIRFIFPLFFLPSLAGLIGSLFIEPMFRPFMPVEEDVA